MSFIQKIIDDSCFVRIEWDNGDSANLNKTNVKFTLFGNTVAISDDSGYFQLLDYTKITVPTTASAAALLTAIKPFADTNPCGGVSPGSAITPAISLTYAGATALIGNIVVGQPYLITDATTNTIPLLVVGTSASTYSTNASDPANTNDVVEYDFSGNKISFRWDVVNNISSYEDWRNGTPACIIDTSHVTNVRLGASCTGHVRGGNVTAGNACVFNLTGSGSSVSNINLKDGCSITDGGFNVSFSELNMENSSSINITNAACINISKINIGVQGQLITPHNVTDASVGVDSSVTLIDNTLSSSSFSIGNKTTVIAANNIVDFSCGDDLSFNSSGTLSNYKSLVTQALSISATAIGGTETAGLYKLNYYLQVTTADAAAVSVLLTITWNDGVARTLSTSVLPLTTTGFLQGDIFIKTNGSIAIKYATTVVTAGTSQYALDLAVSKIK